MRVGGAIVLSIVTAVAACGGTDPTPAGPDASTPADAGTSVPDAAVPPTDAASPDAPMDAGPAGVRFVALGDTGKGNQGQKDVAAGIAAKCAKDGCDFVQLLGDNIYESGVTSTMDPEWKPRFVDPYAGISLEFWAVLGNHDYGGGGLGTEWGKGQNEVDYSAVSPKWRMPAAYWHRSVQNVEFFALDTNMQIFFQDGKQRTDVAAWIAASTATWKIALGHHPYLSNGKHGNAGSYDGIPFSGSNVKSFMENVVCGKVDLYLSGHDHDRQWHKGTCMGTELAVSGAGASTTALGTKNETLFQSDTLGFLYVRIVGKTLTAEFCDQTGKVEFTRTLTKP